MSGLISGLFSLGKRSSEAPVEYEAAKRRAGDADSAVRRDLGRRANVPPEILYYLAEDGDAAVRREIAANPGTPVQADAILARDSDDLVRAQVARKVARLAPGLTDDQQQRAGEIVSGILETLARDHVVQVRAALAEELRSAHNVPVSVVEALANDPEIDVSGPVLRDSPLLSDAFLIEIIASSPVRLALQAVAERRNLSPDVSDAIVETDQDDAIASLLSNESAQIREETLDRLVDRATDVEMWHQPLVARPSLSAKSAASLARFVTDALVERLLDRTDLTPEATEEIGRNVRRRVGAPESAADLAERESAGERAGRMYSAGELDEPEIREALARGERTFVIEAIALLGEINSGAVQKAFSLASAKGVAAVVWKAGLSADAAHQIQLRLARIAPSDALKPAGSSYALSEKDRDWQLEFLGA